jgi:uncharacterized protein (DUF885 family)
MSTRREFLATGAAAALCAGARAAPQDRNAAFDALLRALAEEAAPAGTTDRAASARAATRLRFEKLDAFDPAGLSADAALDYRAIHEGTRQEADLCQRFPYGTTAPPFSPYVVNPRGGAWMTRATPDEIAAQTAQIAADAVCGVVPPDFIMDATLAKLAAAQVSAPPPVAAALAAQIAALKSIRPRAVHDAGVWRLPDGEAYYAALLKLGTSRDIDPQAAHDIGNAQIAELLARADKLLKKQGLAAGTVGARLHALGREPRYLYSDDDTGRTRAVADMNARLARARGRLDPYFKDFAPGEISVQVAGPGRIGYRVAPTATTPGAYYVDLREIGRRPTWSLPTVVHHETLPGHLLQLPIEARAHPRPMRLRYTPNAYSEGWAIYAEQLADEIGLFDGEPLAELGFLQSVLVRAARLAIDTGIHFKRWSREQALARFFDIAGDAPDTLENEVDRIVIQPGFLSGPALGRDTILTLRQTARDKPGFALPDFHERVLKRGQMRLSLLAASMVL